MTSSSIQLPITYDSFVTVSYVLRNEGAVTPTYGSDGAAAMDLYAPTNMAKIVLEPSCSTLIDTGVAFAVPTGWVMEAYTRSGMGIVSNTRLSNCVGIIDSDYRGTVQVGLINDGKAPYTIVPGARIAQYMIRPVPRIRLVRVDELSDTARGTGGLGSTGQ